MKKSEKAVLRAVKFVRHARKMVINDPNTPLSNLARECGVSTNHARALVRLGVVDNNGKRRGGYIWSQKSYPNDRSLAIDVLKMSSAYGNPTAQKREVEPTPVKPKVTINTTPEKKKTKKPSAMVGSKPKKVKTTYKIFGISIYQKEVAEVA